MTIIYDSSASWVENAILNYILRDDDAPGHYIYTNLYASLHTSDPTDNTTTALATEVSGNNYSRVMTSSWGMTKSTGIAKLSSQLNFPTATAAWGTITDVGLFSHATGGSLVFHARVNPNSGVYVDTNQRFSLIAGTNGTNMGPSSAYGAHIVYYLWGDLLNNLTIGKIGLNVYARLYTTMPNINNVGGVEVPTVVGGITTNYTPIQVAGTSKWVIPTSGSTYNLTTITLIATAAIDLGNIVGMCFIDDSSQIIYMFQFNSPIPIYAGDSLRFLPGELKIIAE